MLQFLSILKREWSIFRGNKVMISLYFGAPVLLGLAYGFVYNEGKLSNLPIAVIDKDHSSASAKLIDMLEENDIITVKYVTADNINIQEKLITDGLYGAVLIPPEFEDHLLQKRYTEVNTYVNNTNLLVSGFVTRGISTVVATLNAIESAKTGKSERVKMNTFRLFNRSANYSLYIWPSFIAIFFQAVMLIVVAMSFSTETEKNNFKDFISLGPPAVSILMGKVSLYWMLSLIVLCVYCIYFYLFRITAPEHFLHVLVIAGLFVASVSFQGIIVGLILKSPLQVVQFLMMLNMPAWIASGYSWPFDQNALPAKIYGIIFPYMPFVNGFRTLLVEQGTLYDIREFLQLQMIQLALYFSVAWLLLKYKLKRLQFTVQ